MAFICCQKKKVTNTLNLSSVKIGTKSHSAKGPNCDLGAFHSVSLVCRFALSSCYSECILRTRCIGITWEFYRSAEFQTLPQTYRPESAFLQAPQVIFCRCWSLGNTIVLPDLWLISLLSFWFIWGWVTLLHLSGLPLDVIHRASQPGVLERALGI